jgi:acetyltransferase
VILHDPDTTEEKLPKAAIRPYPIQYAAHWRLKDETPVTIRPIRPEDEPLMVQFHETLSERSIHMRYFHAMKLSQRVAHERLSRVCFNDYDREIALIAVMSGQDGSEKILAIGRLSKVPWTQEAEFSMIVSDQCQRQGLGTELLRRLLDVACQEKISRVTAEILTENVEMQHMCQKIGFQMEPRPEDALIKASIDLEKIESSTLHSASVLPSR